MSSGGDGRCLPGGQVKAIDASQQPTRGPKIGARFALHRCMVTCFGEFAGASAERLGAGAARFATVAVAAAITLAASTAETAPLEDIVKLTQVGVADTVLIELIDMNPTPYSLAPSRLRALQQAGVSDIVLLGCSETGSWRESGIPRQTVSGHPSRAGPRPRPQPRPRSPSRFRFRFRYEHLGGP